MLSSTLPDKSTVTFGGFFFLSIRIESILMDLNVIGAEGTIRLILKCNCVDLTTSNFSIYQNLKFFIQKWVNTKHFAESGCSSKVTWLKDIIERSSAL